jgi:hypothetical protein
LSEALASVADELERARVLGLRVEQAACAIALQGSLDTGVVASLQQLDALIQQIAALRDYLAHVGAACDPSIAVDIGPALARITLEDVRIRLSGVEGAAHEDGWELL